MLHGAVDIVGLFVLWVWRSIMSLSMNGRMLQTRPSSTCCSVVGKSTRVVNIHVCNSFCVMFDAECDLMSRCRDLIFIKSFRKLHLEDPLIKENPS